MHNLKKLVKNSLKLAKHLNCKWLEMTVLAIFLVEFMFPQITLAQSLENQNYSEIEGTTATTDLRFPEAKVDLNSKSLPMAMDKEAKKTIWITITAYSSTVDQCDSTPCITANGFNLCENNQENVVAANFLPFGSEIRMPELFGDRVFTVQDRMNARYTQRMDIWMKTREAAKAFGVKYVKVELL
ncbi:MAG: hypothetical protein WC310_02515 [Patescibacteria group bacterium]|jgi:3D (Asp-Asp-Asp) domain-containing protein